VIAFEQAVFRYIPLQYSPEFHQPSPIEKSDQIFENLGQKRSFQHQVVKWSLLSMKQEKNKAILS
jgi:hypothetical protein